jgi:membrane associated rhomboid family serine protease
MTSIFNKGLWSFFYLSLVSLSLVVVYFFTDDSLRSLLGTHTRDFSRWHTLFTGSFLHGDFEHLWGNIISLIGLGFIFWLLYPAAWGYFFLWQWPVSGLILFSLGDYGENHIGASTWVYSFAGFLAIQTLRVKNIRARALFLALCLWYGSMWWGILPIQAGVSHEGHIAGLLTGVLLGLWKSDQWNKYLRSEFLYVPKSWEGDSPPENPYDQFK